VTGAAAVTTGAATGAFLFWLFTRVEYGT
jgi:hypothetical protein